MPEFFEMFFSTRVAREKDGLIWKPVLRTGVWNVGPNGRPLKVVGGHSKDQRQEIGLQDIVDAYEDGAIEHVTIPKTHDDLVDENTGFVRKLRTHKGTDGVHYLMAAHGFTEPDIARRVENGSIANTSVGLEFDYIRKEDGKRYPVALRHVALTNRPWINRLTPFGIRASDDEYRVFSMEFSEPLEEEPGTARIDEQLTYAQIVSKLEKQTDLHIVNASGDRVLLESPTARYIARFTIEDSEVKLEDRENWITKEKPDPASGLGPILDERGTTEETMPDRRTENNETPPEGVSLADFQKQQSENAALRQQVETLLAEKRNTDSNDLVDTLKELGFTEEKGCTAFLKKARNIVLSDKGEGILMLSEEDGQTPQPYSASRLIVELFASLPNGDRKVEIKLAEQHGDPLRDSDDKRRTTNEEPDRRTELSERDFDELEVAMFGGPIKTPSTTAAE